MKNCSKCHTDKTIDHFNKKGKKKDGTQRYQPYCRDCQSDYIKTFYQKNKKRHIELVRERMTRVRHENRTKLMEFYNTQECMDCGNADARVLEPDHREDEEKSANVSRLIAQGNSWEKVLTELAKCDIVCSNCHRIRTYSRMDNCYRNLAL